MRDPHSPGGHKVHAGLTPNLLSQLVDGREKKNRYEERRCRSHRPVGRLLFFFFSFFSNTPFVRQKRRSVFLLLGHCRLLLSDLTYVRFPPYHSLAHSLESETRSHTSYNPRYIDSTFPS